MKNCNPTIHVRCTCVLYQIDNELFDNKPNTIATYPEGTCPVSNSYFSSVRIPRRSGSLFRQRCPCHEPLAFRPQGLCPGSPPASAWRPACGHPQAHCIRSADVKPAWPVVIAVDQLEGAIPARLYLQCQSALQGVPDQVAPIGRSQLGHRQGHQLLSVGCGSRHWHCRLQLTLS